MRLIDADEAIINFGFEWDDICPTRDEVVSFLRKQKTISAVPVVRGEWKTWEEQFPDRTNRKKNNLGVFCSACQLHADNMTSFCPNCGARMDGEP